MGFNCSRSCRLSINYTLVIAGSAVIYAGCFRPDFFFTTTMLNHADHFSNDHLLCRSKGSTYGYSFFMF